MVYVLTKACKALTAWPSGGLPCIWFAYLVLNCIEGIMSKRKGSKSNAVSQGTSYSMNGGLIIQSAVLSSIISSITIVEK